MSSAEYRVADVTGPAMLLAGRFKTFFAVRKMAVAE